MHSNVLKRPHFALFEDLEKVVPWNDKEGAIVMFVFSKALDLSSNNAFIFLTQVSSERCVFNCALLDFPVL